ncbi:MAG: RnfABCDGE type electron transport complex subunit D [Thermodesulfobacteriota bacterium]|nr:RnfABCDGE type electron transport complex subunit D [Thermodesulfobacteriota bacterium]
MNEQNTETGKGQSLQASPSPHLSNASFTTRGMMVDVLIALAPVIIMAVYMFRIYAVKQLVICLISTLAAEAIFTKMRKKPLPLMDCSAAVTGLILGLSLPGPAPWYVGVIGSFVAIGIGKTIFGGLGMNIFNPAMVGRAFVMIAFAGSMAASGFMEAAVTNVDVITQATPLDSFKQSGVITPLMDLFLGTTNGSLGEISAVACLLGGIYLCIRRTASWEIPAAIIGTVIVLGGIANLVSPDSGWTVMHHLFGGALLFGAFYIATDPVTSPLTRSGKVIFGVGVGAMIMLLRIFSGYPEGVMFAVLMMNALTPLLNRWTIPKPFGAIKEVPATE